jgi:Ca2+-binding RTX toxin-like protein
VNEGTTAANSGTYGDVPADTVGITASLGSVTFAAGTWNWSYNATDDLPTQPVTITANDGDTGIAIATFNLTVQNVNPTSNAGGPYLTFDDTPITLQGSGSDVAADVPSLTYLWDLDGDSVFGEAGVGATRGNETGANPLFNPIGLSGSVVVSLRVADGDGGLAVDTATIDVLTQGTLLIDGTLYVVGSNTANDMALISQFGGNIEVNATFNSSGSVSVSASAVNAIEVRLRNGHDVFLTTSSVTAPMTIDGGGGNDLLTSGSGDDLLLGGSGTDILYGNAGEDVLLGGIGNDDLFGGNGHDVLIGGDGNDMLYGGLGRDLLIGSQDEDLLDSGSDDDILIGGYTSHDSYDSAGKAAIDAVMAIWTSSSSFSSRVSSLASSGLLQSGVTVFDDNDSDVIVGGSGRDLVFGDISQMSDGVKDIISLSTFQDTLIAVN